MYDQVRVHGRKGLISRVLQLELETSDKSVQSFPVLVGHCFGFMLLLLSFHVLA